MLITVLRKYISVKYFCVTILFVKRLTFIVVCFLAINVLAKPQNSSSQNAGNPAQQTGNTSPTHNKEKSTTNQEAPKPSPPRWYTSSEWWLVIIAALTGFAIAYQAREMTRATNVMKEQSEDIKKQTEIQTKTLILQYRPKIIVRNAKASQFSFELEKPWECEIRFEIINAGGSPAYITTGSRIQMASAIGRDVGKIEIKWGDERPISCVTLQAGQGITVEECIPTGVLFSTSWENFRKGIPVNPLRFMHLTGVIYYEDDLRIPRSTGIFRDFDPKTDEFMPVKGAEQEYSD